MGLHHEFNEHGSNELFEDKVEDLPKKRAIKKRIEEKLEAKRLRGEISDDWDLEYDWSYFDKKA